jgi:hypothetical protein
MSQIVWSKTLRAFVLPGEVDKVIKFSRIRKENKLQWSYIHVELVHIVLLYPVQIPDSPL